MWPPVVVETMSPAEVADPATTLTLGPTTAPGCAVEMYAFYTETVLSDIKRCTLFSWFVFAQNARPGSHTLASPAQPNPKP